MIFRKVWNKIEEIYSRIYEWFYITFNKTTYWQYDLTNETVYCSVSGGVLYINLEDYRLMESDEIGRIIFKNLKEEQVPIKVVV